MKVVVLDHPKVVSFFLRKIYGIKKVKAIPHDSGVRIA